VFFVFCHFPFQFAASFLSKCEGAGIPFASFGLNDGFLIDLPIPKNRDKLCVTAKQGFEITL
jgi:hypothetical protein